MPLFQNATFYISAHHLRDLPAPAGIEVAFAGRSNAGKSSALNTLANHNRLAYVSKQPGRTQLINFFSLGNDRFLVDLPGYGYAKVPVAMREHWQLTLSRYLSERRTLGGLVFIAGLSSGFDQPLTMALISLRTKADERALAVSARLTGNRLGQFLLPMAAGVLANGSGVGAVFWSMAALLGASLVASAAE